MSRTVITTPQIRLTLTHYTPDYIAVVPHPQRRAGHPFNTRTNRLMSLSQFAQKIIRQHNVAIAPKITAYNALTDAATHLGYSDPEGTARSVSGTIVLLLRSGVDWERMEQESTTRSRKLAQLARTYLNILHENNFIDEAESLWEAAKDCPEAKKLFIYGYTRLEPNELEFVNKIAADGSILVLPYGTNAIFNEVQSLTEKLQSLGWKVEEMTLKEPGFGESCAMHFLNSSSSPASTIAWVFPNMEAEVRGVLVEVKRLLKQSVLDTDIALVTENERDYYPILLQVAWEFGMDIRVYYEIPIAEMRLGSWLMLLCDCLENDFPYEATLRLLKHTLGGKIDLTPEELAEARLKHPHGLAEWLLIKPEMRDIALQSAGTGKDFGQQLKRIIELFDIRKRCARWARELMAYYEFVKALPYIAQYRGQIELKRYLDDLRESLRIVTSPVEPGRTGVELHNPHSLIGSSYRQIFVLGAAETILPTVVSDDPILDFYERAELGKLGIELASPAAEARRKKMEFWSLLNTISENLCISYPKLVGNTEQLPSPYSVELGLNQFDTPEYPPASPEEWRQKNLMLLHPEDDVVIESASHAYNVELNREQNPTYDEYDGIVGIPYDYENNHFSVSQLSVLGRCPFRWFCDRLLRLSPPEEMEEELSPMNLGTLYHKTLELLLIPFKRREIRLEDIISGLGQALDDAQRAVEFYIPDWLARRPELFDRLRVAVSAKPFISPETEILELELKPETLVEFGGFRLDYRIDRLDRTNGELEIVDYKSGSSLTSLVLDEEGRLKFDIQLPIYVNLVSSSGVLEGEEIRKGRFYSVNRASNLGNRYDAQKTDVQILMFFLENMKDLLQTGQFPVKPDIYQEACRYCDYDLICRRGSRLAIKESSRGVQ